MAEQYSAKMMELLAASRSLKAEQTALIRKWTWILMLQFLVVLVGITCERGQMRMVNTHKRTTIRDVSFAREGRAWPHEYW